MAYSKENLIELLKDLHSKYNQPITYKLLINEENFPSRKVFTRIFGSWQQACLESNVPYQSQKHKYDINDAQHELDIRNGNFDIIQFTNVKSKSKIQCRTCGYIWDTPIYSLYDNTSKSKGCPICNIHNCNYIKQLEKNNLTRIKYLSNNKGIYKCKICNYEFESYLNNVIRENFHCQNCSQVDNKQYKMIKLLNESLQSFYILGFLLADGHFYNTGRIKLMLKQSDKNIIDEIVQYLEIQDSISIDKKSYGFQCMDIYTSKILKDKYQISNNKTYIPCDLSSLQGDKFLAFLIGFIDGDGSIGFRTDTKNPKIVIKLHKSWENNLNYISKTLYEICNKSKYPKASIINQKQGVYTSITFQNQTVLKMLRNFIQTNNLFYLRRKWSKLDNII